MRMSDTTRYRENGEAMLRAAGNALSPLERRSYLEIAAAWNKLADEAGAMEFRKTGATDGVLVPFDGDVASTPVSEAAPEPEAGT